MEPCDQDSDDGGGGGRGGSGGCGGEEACSSCMYLSTTDAYPLAYGV